MTDQSTYVGVGRRLRAAREALGLTQEELGRQLGVAGPTISRYESASSHIPVSDLLRIARALGVHPVYLLTGEQPNQNEKLLWEVQSLPKEDQRLVNEFVSFLLKRHAVTDSENLSETDAA